MVPAAAVAELLADKMMSGEPPCWSWPRLAGASPGEAKPDPVTIADVGPQGVC